MAASGDEVSVFALVRRRSEGTGFIAGMWQEDDGDPRRQYGLFIDLRPTEARSRSSATSRARAVPAPVCPTAGTTPPPRA
ncbi:hypothetical protein [Rathayibacter sp. VKM Ac-2630]|uniref:hypothetical protein n=1 Tax=Rathayibacter sp. VKM Ac-2630 TaxID=1938617 RepID=UPI0011154FF4|nr:hypothetical protein [Rathayibacter sp. VKM Ac-2630]